MRLYDDVNDDHDGLGWLTAMACSDLDWFEFFVEPGHVISPETQAVCVGCPVREQCLTHAYHHEYPAGYFGGKSPSFRKRYPLDAALNLIREEVVTARA